MPNIIDANGLQVKSLPEITLDLQTAYRAIYGSSINLGSNTPDGQLIGILAQNISDLLQLMVAINSSFSIDSVFGVLLDQRVAMSGVKRKAGTYTTAWVTVTVSQALNLVGAGPDPLNPIAGAFTVADGAGNQYQLIGNHSFVAAGSANLLFRSVVLGQIQTSDNTIQNIVTTQLGVSDVNNPDTSMDTEGLPEETDPQLKLRRANSFALQAVGPSASIRAALLQVADITDAYVVENNTNATVNTVPAYSCWIIVGGGTAPEIAQAIYAKKGSGSPMKGSVSQNVAQPQGDFFTAKWDVRIGQVLTLRATLNPKIPGTTFDLITDATKLANALIYKLGQHPCIGDIIQALAVIEPNAVLSVVNVSKDAGTTWADIVAPNDAQHYFTVAAVNITLTQG